MTAPVTHFAWPDTLPADASPWAIQRALCGETIRKMESRHHPTCPICAERLEAWDRRQPEEEV
jgi:hypothetical protein